MDRWQEQASVWAVEHGLGLPEISRVRRVRLSTRFLAGRGLTPADAPNRVAQLAAQVLREATGAGGGRAIVIETVPGMQAYDVWFHHPAWPAAPELVEVPLVAVGEDGEQAPTTKPGTAVAPYDREEMRKRAVEAAAAGGVGALSDDHAQYP